MVEDVALDDEPNAVGGGGDGCGGRAEDRADPPTCAAIGEGFAASAVKVDGAKTTGNDEQGAHAGEGRKQSDRDGNEEGRGDGDAPQDAGGIHAEALRGLLRVAGFGRVHDQLGCAAVRAKTFTLKQAISAAVAQRVHELTLSHAERERNARFVMVRKPCYCPVKRGSVAAL